MKFWEKNAHTYRATDIIGIIKDITIIILGLVISSFGIAVFYAAEMGSSPMATFCDGVHTIFGISYGLANMLVNALLLVVLFFLDRKYINIGTVLCVFAIGPFINLFTAMLAGLDLAHAQYVLRVLCTVAGTALMGLGLGLYVAVDRGLGALEGFVKILCVKNGFSYAKAKILQDVVLVAGGIALDAKWGVGTVLAIMLTGPAFQASTLFFAKLLGTAVPEC